MTASRLPPPSSGTGRPRRWWRRLAVGAVALIAIASVGVWVFLRLHPSPPAGGQPQNSGWPISAVEFVTPADGWVGATQPAGGSVLATTDGGRHWRAQLSLPGMTPRWIHFLDSRRGFVLASASAERGKPEQLYRTTDGGAHWTLLRLPSPSTTYFSGGMISFSDTEHGWYLVPAFGGQNSEDFTLYRTVDGGATWGPLFTLDIGHPASHGMTNEGAKTGLRFGDAQTGWTSQASHGQAVVWLTSDGGVDWQEETLPQPPGGWSESAQINVGTPVLLPDGRGALEAFSLGPSAAPGGPTLAYTYTTTDGGHTWTGPRALPRTSGRGAAPPGPAATAFATASEWWYGVGSELYVTDDAGQHWREAGAAPGQFSFTRVQDLDGVHGWAVVTTPQHCGQQGPCATTGALMRTSDGGRRWDLVHLPSG